jgi:5'-phosphate synthase pdxT subunit
MSIGILALQGGYEAHAKKLQQLGADWHYVRYAEELLHATGLIIPGGESTTALKLLNEDLLNAIKRCGESGVPIFGTCAGAILLAKKILSPSQLSLGLVDLTIERNAYGRQLSSHIAHGQSILKTDPIELVFIRAPRFCYFPPETKVLVKYEEEAVCIEQCNYVLATFHPELTEDLTLHQYFLDKVNIYKSREHKRNL